MCFILDVLKKLKKIMVNYFKGIIIFLGVGINETCNNNEQCTEPNTQCFDGKCSCLYDMTPQLKEGKLICSGKCFVLL